MHLAVTRSLARPALLLLAVLVGLGLLAVPSSSAAPGTGSNATGASTVLREPPGANDDFPRLPAECYDVDGTLADAPCQVRYYGSNRPSLIVWGDSHAWMYLPSVRRLATQRKVNLTYLLHGSCPPSMRLPKNVDARQSSCDKSNDRARTYIDQLRHRRAGLTVLVNGHWAGYRADYRRMQREAAGGAPSGIDPYHQHMARLGVLGTPELFKWLGRRDLTVDTIGQAATVPTSPRACQAGREPYQCDLPRARALDREVDNRRWLRDRMRDLSGPSILIDPSPAYCDVTTCYAHVNGTNTFFDDLHLAAGLTKQLSGYFVPVFDQIRRASR